MIAPRLSPISSRRFLPAVRVRNCYAWCLCLLTTLCFANASPGDFDGSFGAGGVASFPMPNGNGVARDLSQLPDGTLLVGGTQGITPLLVKLSSAGQVDPTFGVNGFDSVRRGTKFFQDVMALASAPPSRFTVVEFHGNPCVGAPIFCNVNTFKDMFARRINGDGSVDASYGTGGAALIPSSEGSLAITPSGAVIVLTMRAQIVAAPIFGVAALRPDGQRDPAYEQNALDALNCGPQFTPGSVPVGVTRLIGGKLLVAMGVTPLASMTPNRTLCVTRLNEDGSLDTAFATNGHLLFQSASLVNHFPFKILVRSDGRILVVLLDGPRYAIQTVAFVWLTPNGGLDNAFVSGGVTYPANVLVSSVVDVNLQADDKILIVGYNSAAPGASTFPLDPTRPVLARLQANGAAFDVAFGSQQSGFRILTTGTGWLSPQEVLASTAGGIFVLGTSIASTPTPTDALFGGDFAIAKLRDASDSGNGGGGGGGGGCAMIQPTRGGPIDPTLPLLLILALAWSRFPNFWRRSFR
jgi:uncharacterized delta-60 repeat protein